jgi:hypothetical protein
MRGRWLVVLAGVLVLGAGVAAAPGQAVPTGATASGPSAAPAPGDAMAHLDQLLARSRPPEYRRFGSPGMAAAADYAAGVLTRAGYLVHREDAPGTVYRPDYAPGAAPLLERLSDGHRFPVESAFRLEAVTPPGGITCTVRVPDQVRRGDCGFVSFVDDSPSWTNTFTEDALTKVDQVIRRGGVGVVLQGDVARHALIALSVRRPLPAVVAVAPADQVVGRRVRLRVRGGPQDATLHDVIAVRPPSDPRLGYTLLQGHLDGWFTAAADNGGGAAAVLAAAEVLAHDRSGRGLLVALYDGEEWGLLGSRAFARDLADADGVAMGPCGPTIRMRDIVSVVNLDAPSALPSDSLGAVTRRLTGAPESLVSYRALVFSDGAPTLTLDLVRDMAAAGVLGLPLPRSVVNPYLGGGMDRTDGKWFDAVGIPVAWPVAESPEYHTTADTRVAVDPADLRRIVAGTVQLVRDLATATIPRTHGPLPPPGTAGVPSGTYKGEQHGPRCP